MGKYADTTITCSQCGKGFMFTEDEQEFYKTKGYTPPLRCKRCRTIKRQQNGCSQCGNNIVDGSPVYCAACQIGLQLEFEAKTRGLKKAIEEANTKICSLENENAIRLAEINQKLRSTQDEKDRLQAEVRLQINLVEAEKAKMAESLRQNEQTIAALQQDLNNSANELQKALKWRSNLDYLEPILNSLIEKSNTLERNQDSLKEVVLQVIERTEGNHKGVGIPEAIKGLLRLNRRSQAPGG